MKLLLTLTLLALPALSADAKSEIAAVRDAMDKANTARDTVAYAKHLTDGYFNVVRSGAIRDKATSIEVMKSGPPVPPDLKREILFTHEYGSTVIQAGKESATSSKGDKIQMYVTWVYVKQAGVWKLASRTSTNISAGQ